MHGRPHQGGGFQKCGMGRLNTKGSTNVENNVRMLMCPLGKLEYSVRQPEEHMHCWWRVAKKTCFAYNTSLVYKEYARHFLWGWKLEGVAMDLGSSSFQMHGVH